MIITTRNLLQYLLAKGLVSSESVVDGDFAVVDVSGRNRNFKILRQHGPSYFVKQIQHWDAQTIAMLQCEAACYWLPRNDSDFASLVPLTPEFDFYDPERQILITRLIMNGEDLWEYFRRLGKFESDVTAELGGLLGTYHSALGTGLNESPQSSIFPRQIPWILSSERRNSHPFKQLSPATAELFDSVEKSPNLCEALDELRNNWNTTALMHGDLKLENCILSRDKPDSMFSITIVDWELADIGDPCWDIGSILQAFLSARTMCLPESKTPLSVRTLFCGPSGRELGESIISFWQRYVQNLRIEYVASHELLQLCLRYSAARMIQSAYEYMQFSPHLSTNAFHLLELSKDILKDPADVVGLLHEARGVSISNARTIS